MKIYRQDVRICGTVYIKAKSMAEAMSKLKAMAECCIDTEANHEADLPVSGLRFDDPNLPDVSLSPAMTLKGIEPGCLMEIAD